MFARLKKKLYSHICRTNNILNFSRLFSVNSYHEGHILQFIQQVHSQYIEIDEENALYFVNIRKRLIKCTGVRMPLQHER